jgi:hypothetical protein
MSIWIWTLETVESAPVLDVDLTDFEVEAVDGKIGKVDGATYEPGSAGLVVDTGFWIFGKKRLLPAGLVEHIDPEERKVYVAATKEQVKSAPDDDEARREDAGFRDEIGSRFEPSRYRGMRGDPNGPTAGTEHVP